MNKIVFIGGIHGVGKTYFCNKLANTLDIPHFSASDLIAKQRNLAFTESKSVEKIDENQDYLIQAIHNFTSEHPVILLDGHFCLLNKEDNISRVPEETFIKMKPACYVVLQDASEKIALRLNERDGRAYNPDFLESFQLTEIEYANELAGKYTTPLFIQSTNSNEEQVIEYIKSHTNN